MHQRYLAVVLVTLAVLAGCRSTGTAYNPPTGILSGHGIVVSDVVNNAILRFPLTGNGSNTAPTSALSGASTQLDQPEGSFLDKAHGHIWVGNYTSGSNGTLTEYAMNASGNVAPIATLGGTTTTLEGPGGIYVDASGTIYVADYRSGTLDVFAAGATGDVAPIRQITGLDDPSGVWLDSSGNIWVGSPYSEEIFEFANNASGAATPLATITSSSLAEVMGVYIDKNENVWAANCNGGVVEFAHGVTGSGVTPTVDIAGSNTGFSCPNGVVVDSSGNIYVADYGAPAVYVFSAGANGNVAPTQTIPANATTTLAKPIGVIVY